MNYRLKPTKTIIRQMPNGDRVRVVAADSYLQKVKVIRCKDAMPMTVDAADIALLLPA